MATKFYQKAKFKISVAAAIAIFTLASTFSATIAWFNANLSYSTSVGNFEVAVTGSCDLDSVRLIKFDYSTTTYGSITTTNWLNPEDGHVNSYNYNYGQRSFGVDAMNPYDPVDRVVRGTSLKDLNCNAVYEVSFIAHGIGTVYFQLSSSLFTVTKDKDEDILLSDCVDIDIYYEDDLLDTNPLFTIEDDGATALVNEYDEYVYYPTYKFEDVKMYYKWNGSSWDESTDAPTGDVTNKGTVNYESCLPATPSTGDYYYVLKSPLSLADTSAELENADIYYKISYLSSLKASNAHDHFYGNPKLNTLDIVEDKSITFEDGVPVKFYINVNYAPSIADVYMRNIYLNDIIAKYDYGFKFDFLMEPRS